MAYTRYIPLPFYGILLEIIDIRWQFQSVCCVFGMLYVWDGPKRSTFGRPVSSQWETVSCIPGLSRSGAQTAILCQQEHERLSDHNDNL